MKQFIFLFLWVYFLLFTIYFIIGFFDIYLPIGDIYIFEMIVLGSSYLDIAKTVIFIPLVPLIFVARNIELSTDVYEVFTFSLATLAICFYYAGKDR